MFLSREHGAARHGMVNENGKRKRKNVEERIKNSHNDITQSLLHKIEAFLLILPLSVTRQSRTPAASCGKKLLFGHLCPCLSKGQVGHLINSWQSPLFPPRPGFDSFNHLSPPSGRPAHALQPPSIGASGSTLD